MKKKPGRPTIGKKPFADKMLIECQPAQKRKWKAAAARHDPKLSLSEWVRRTLDAAAS